MRLESWCKTQEIIAIGKCRILPESSSPGFGPVFQMSYHFIEFLESSSKEVEWLTHLDDDFPAGKPWLFEIESLSMENQWLVKNTGLYPKLAITPHAKNIIIEAISHMLHGAGIYTYKTRWFCSGKRWDSYSSTMVRIWVTCGPSWRKKIHRPKQRATDVATRMGCRNPIFLPTI